MQTDKTGTITEIAAALADSRHVVVLTGAGISTESGIPDFRGPNGVWTKNPEAERMATLHHYMSDPSIRVKAWKARLENASRNAQPNPGHLALVEMERKEKLHSLVTQNVDGLHILAGTAPDRLIEIHGTMRDVMCMSCDERAPMERALERVLAGEEDPPCRTCGGILKSATISFGQNLVERDLFRAQEAAATCDFFMAIGTSLAVYPVAYLPQMALENGAKLLIVNAEPTPMDGLATWSIQAQISDVLPEIAVLLPWS